MSKTSILFSLLIAVLCNGAPTWARQRVILVTIDGLEPSKLTDNSQPLPFLHQYRDEGYFLPEVQSVCPSMTYPAHTSIITGVTPRQHGIHCNRVFQYNRAEPLQYHWYADSIQVPTLWQWVKEHGGTTASLFWPVSTGSPYIDYNVPEYYPATKTEIGAMDYIRPVCTPAGFLDELEREATGRLTDTTLRANSYEYDAKTAYMANYIENRYRPDLLTVHLITTDYKQHATGLHSAETRQAYASADNAIGLLVENLQYTHQLDSVTLVVTGDHGFVEAQCRLRPNVWLVQAGLLSAQPGGDWKACFHSVSAASYLYLNPALTARQKQRTLQHIRQLLSQQPDSIGQWYTVLEPDSVSRLGGDPQAALCLSAQPGAGCSNQRIGQPFEYVHGGYHGYMQPCTPTCLLVYGGPAVRTRKMPPVHSLLDVSALIKSLLQ